MKGLTRTLPLALAFVAACADVSHIPKTESVEDKRAALASRAEADVRDQMNDPDAARFKPEPYINLEGECVRGQVLGKNGFGAYVGYQTYIWTKGRIRFDEGNVLTDTRAYYDCMDAGKKPVAKAA